MEEQKKKSWFGRNWPWAVPAGGCLTLIIIAAIGIGAVFVKMPELLNNLEPITYGITEASTNEYVIEALGEPIEGDRHGETKGDIDFKNKNSDINISMPLKGPKGTAELVIKGKKENDEWIYEKLVIIVNETGEEINLLENTSGDF